MFVGKAAHKLKDAISEFPASQDSARSTR